MSLEGLGRPATAALLALAVVAGPLLGYLLLLGIGPAILWLKGPDSHPFWLSLRVALTATVIGGGAGIAAGYALAKGRFAGRDLLEALGSLPIILPPTVLGYYLLVVLGDSVTGRALTGLFGHPMLFNVTACVIAASVAAFPFCMRATRAAIEGVDPRLEQAATAMGLPPWQIATRVTLPLARRGLAAGLTLGFARSLGEYGATLMVGGNFAGRTQTMSLAVGAASTSDQRELLVRILVVMALVSLVLIAGLGRSRA